MSISSSAVLVRLSISTWTGRKIDKHQSENVSAATGADKKAGKYIKDTMVGSTHVSQLNKFANNSRMSTPHARYLGTTWGIAF